MKVGDIVNQAPYYGRMAGGGGFHQVEPGRVVYIHPQRRFYTLEFTFRTGKFRESYYFRGRRGSSNSCGDRIGLYAPNLTHKI